MVLPKQKGMASQESAIVNTQVPFTCNSDGLPEIYQSQVTSSLTKLAVAVLAEPLRHMMRRSKMLKVGGHWGKDCLGGVCHAGPYTASIVYMGFHPVMDILIR